MNPVRFEIATQNSVRPQSRSSAKPATAVGIAVGRLIVTISALRPQKLYFESTYAAKSPKTTLKTVAQKLVTIES
jgi:hypothetical protein